METKTATTAQNSTQVIVLAQTERQSTRIKKLRFLEAYRATHGNVSLAAKYAGIHRDTYYEWVKDDPEFKDETEYVLWELNSIVEDKLLEKIMQGDGPSIRFYLSHRHPDYIRKSTPVVAQPIVTLEDLLDQCPYA